MNKVILMGRLTKDPETNYGGSDNSIAITQYTLAVDREYKRDGDDNADFIRCVAFGKSGEFASKHFQKGLRVAVVGRIRTGSYTKQDGTRVYTTDVNVERQYFADGKRDSHGDSYSGNYQSAGGDNPYGEFKEIEEDDGLLPF